MLSLCLIILQKTIILEESISMEEKMLIQNWSGSLGKLLYQSSWKKQQDQSPALVQLYERAIKCQNMFLPYTFETRFMINQNNIVFCQQEREQTYALLQNDQQHWRNILKQYMNQMGFHEKFKPIKKIGKGNFASVYLAEKIDDKGKYAVKAFSKEAAYSEQNGKECLIKQIEIMRNLNNRHNMKLSEVFQSQNSLYIIFELLEGGQLFEKIKAKEKFKPTQVKTMILGILQGLREMHSKNIMHRDLKPENILFRGIDTYDCVIADYGLAEFADSEEYLFVRCGTPGYVAPEVINIKDMKAKYGPICDIFSLGLIFHLLLFGKSVFKGKTYSQVLNENRACSFDFQGPQYQQVESLTMDLLRKMLKINPEQRITAEQALSHPYFKETQNSSEELVELMDTVQIGESPILTTANQKRKQVKELIRDSCLDFKMAKDNMFTGKTQTVGTVGSGKISGFGAGLLKGLKASKFVKPTEAKQN